MKSLIFIPAALWICLCSLTAEGGELQDLNSRVREMQKQINIMEEEIQTLQQKTESSTDELTTLEQDIIETRYTLGEGVSVGERVRVGGWADFIFETNNSKNFDKNSDPDDDNFDETTFRYHLFAINFNTDLSDRFRFFGEAEFRGSSGNQVSNVIFGSSEEDTFSVERAYLDYSRSQKVNIRMGKFWTPFGIWNQEFVAPLVRSIRYPLLFRKEIIPKTTTGLALSGRSFLNDRWYWGYALWVGNGDGGDPDFQDDNADKGLGGHFYTSIPRLEGLRLGATFYRQNVRTSDYKANEKVYGMDILYEKNDIELKAEFLWKDINRLSDSGMVMMNPAGFDSEHKTWYVQPAYNLNEWWTAYVRLDYQDIDGFKSNNMMPNQDLSIWTLGLNYRPVPAVRFKLEYHLHIFDGPVNALGVNKDFEMLVGSVSVIF